MLYSFCSQENCADGAGPAAALLDVKGVLFGTTTAGGTGSCGTQGCGTVFSLDPETRAEKVLYSFCSQQNCKDGAVPEASVIDVKGTLYGTTASGGVNRCGCGTIFSLDPDTGAETVLHSFAGHVDGKYPWGLVDVQGTLYGTTNVGGAHDHGTAFALTDP